MLDRKYLPIVTVIFVAALIALPGVFGTSTTPLAAYAWTLGIYWLTCWGIILLWRPGVRAAPTSRRMGKILRWVIWLPALGILFFTISKAASLPSPSVGALLVVAALVNGLTEEFFWRRTFADIFSNDVIRGLIFPWILFTLWHVALLRIPGVHYQGGAFAMIGGAGFMGALWGLSYWRNRNLAGICAAHATANVFAFWLLAIDNGWAH